METAQRLAGCSFGVSGVRFWGELRAFTEQMETAQWLAGCSFGFSGVLFWGELRAFEIGGAACRVYEWRDIGLVFELRDHSGEFHS